MSNTIGWGKGAQNNSIGWGNVGTNGFGSIYERSRSGETVLAFSDPNFIMEVDTSLGDGLSSMALPIQGTQPMTVDWGDGTVETVTQTALPASTNWVTHSYASGGVYEIKVSEALERIYFANTGDKDKAVKVLNWGDCVWSSFNLAFRGCSLTELPNAPILNGQNITDFSGAFIDNNLTSIPTGLFNNCPNVTDFSFTFYINQITSIPTGLFNNCPNVTDFSGAFFENNLTSIPVGLFDNCPNVTDFSLTFRLNEITSIPVGLFDNCPNVANFVSTFRQNQITSIPTGLFDNCPNVTNFSFTFRQNLITSIPVGLFNNCPNVTDFSFTFYINEITSIPDNIFSNSVNVTTFADCFLGNTLPVNDLSRLYIELSLFQTQNNVPFHGGSGQYDPNFAALSTTTGVERDALIARGWTLTDGGPIV